MDVTRDVILDLLPLYLAEEVSADTRVLVESYLAIDPELAKMAELSAAMALPEDIPMTLTLEDKMETYKQTKRLMFWRTVILAAIISVTLMFVLVWAGAAYMVMFR